MATRSNMLPGPTRSAYATKCEGVPPQHSSMYILSSKPFRLMVHRSTAADAVDMPRMPEAQATAQSTEHQSTFHGWCATVRPHDSKPLLSRSCALPDMNSSFGRRLQLEVRCRFLFFF